eukprot:403362863
MPKEPVAKVYAKKSTQKEQQAVQVEDLPLEKKELPTSKATLESLDTSLEEDQGKDKASHDRPNIRDHVFREILSCPLTYIDEFDYYKMQQEIVMNDNYDSIFQRLQRKADLISIVEVNQYISRITISINENVRMKEYEVIHLEMDPVNKKDSKYVSFAIVKQIHFANEQMIVVMEISIRSYVRKEFIKLPNHKEHFYQQEVEYQLVKCENFENSMTSLNDFVRKFNRPINELIRDSIISGKILTIPDSLLPQEVPDIPFTISKRLSHVQKQIVEKTLYPGLHLIQGGGGCGKSFTLISIVQSWLELLPIGSSTQILICAPSNCAIDLIAERMHQIQFLKDKFVRVFSDTREDVFKMTLDNLQPFSLLHKALFYGEQYYFDEDAIYEPFKNMGVNKHGIKFIKNTRIDKFFNEKDRVEQMILKKIPIVLCTLAGSNDIRLKHMTFQKVIIDEATQAKEFETLKPMLHAETAVLIGDHKQLGPTYLEYKIDGPQSLFERLVMNKNEYSLLKIQYRSHPAIVAPLNNIFYDNRLESQYYIMDAETRTKAFINDSMPIMFIDTKGCCIGESKYESSWYNQYEIDLVQKVFEQMRFIGIDQGQIGIVTPYIGQLNKLKEQLHNQIDPNGIGSVDSWQGRETDYSIISTVRTRHLGFVKDPNRMNVALSRARHGMIIIGNSQCLSQDENWNKYLTYLLMNWAIVSHENFNFAKYNISFVRRQA